MHINEKERIMTIAVREAMKNGFEFGVWAASKFRLAVGGGSTHSGRLWWMVSLGVEDALLFDHEFMRALFTRRWKGILTKLAQRIDRVACLLEVMKEREILKNY